MTWLITGGAGYVGAHVVHAMQGAGERVVVLDDLSTGVARRLPDGVAMVHGSVLDRPLLDELLTGHGVTGVVHLAARKQFGESVELPLRYYRENVYGLTVLLEAAVAAGVRRFLFSSSAAVYGVPDVEFITEETPCAPINPYGETKLAGEWMLRALGAADPALRWAALRYFNVAGTGSPELADRSIANLIPMTFDALSAGRNPQLFGDDYPTRDGSCIRDYIHVVDLAEAHAAAARRLDDGPLGEVYNVGRGEGISVKEVLGTVREVTGVDFTVDVVARRPGDAPAYFADATKIGNDLGWTARLDLTDMVRSSWEAWQSSQSAR
jgi:UDP-glucose 4-epimerase